MKQRVTSSDVAKKAGVSQSTVSMVLSGKENISIKVRERVLQIANEMGYSGKPPAAVKKKNKTVGILIDLKPLIPFVWSFERPILECIEEYLNSRGFNLVLIPINPDITEAELYTKIISYNIDGLISMLYVQENTFQRLHKINIPVVVMMNDALQNQFPAVLVDDFQGVFDGTSHLVSLGHKNLLYIDYERPDMPSTILDRLYGFKKAVEQHNLEIPESQYIRCATPAMTELKERLISVFSSKKTPTGIMALDDYIGASIIFTLQNLKITVPEDVSLITMGDVLDYDIPFIPPITTVRINTSMAGKMAGRLLSDIMEHNIKEPQILKVTPTIFDRGSCTSR